MQATTAAKIASERGSEQTNSDETLNASLPRKVEVEERPLVEPRKKVRTDDAVVQNYAPQWGVLANDALISSAPSHARDLGPDLYRGLVLSVNRPFYDKVEMVDAYTEMLALILMIRFLP